MALRTLRVRVIRVRIPAARLSKKMRICIFGDSITCGYYDKKGGWAQRLKAALEKASNYSVYILGIDGGTTNEVLDKSYIEIEIRKPDIVIFAIGINDSRYSVKEDKFYTSAEQFGANIEELIRKARRFTDNIYLVGLTPVDETKTKPISWDDNIEYHNQNIKEYNNILKETAKREKTNFIDIWEEFLNIDYKRLLADGLHPNDEGHKKIFEIVRDGFNKQ